MAVATADDVACGTADASGPNSNGVTTLRYQGWTDPVTLPELAEDLGYFEGKVKLNWVGNTISGPQDIQSAATGQTDFGGAFAGAVAKLESAGAPIKAVINYYGYDQKTFCGYYVLNNSPIKSARDLIGKKVGVNTLGGQNEADIHDYLRQQGLSEADVKKVQLVALPPPNTEDALRHHQIDVAALGGQFQQHAVRPAGCVRCSPTPARSGRSTAARTCSATTSSPRTPTRSAPSSPVSPRRSSGSATRRARR